MKRRIFCVLALAMLFSHEAFSHEPTMNMEKIAEINDIVDRITRIQYLLAARLSKSNHWTHETPLDQMVSTLHSGVDQDDLREFARDAITAWGNKRIEALRQGLRDLGVEP